MQRELRHYNSIGNIDGIDLFEESVFEKNIHSEKTIFSLVSSSPGTEINVKAAILFYTELGLLTFSNDRIIKTEIGTEICKLSSSERRREMATKCYEYIVSNRFVNENGIHFDTENKLVYLDVNSIALSVSIFRNYLITTKFLVFKQNRYYIPQDYGRVFESLISKESKKTTIEQLLKSLEAKQKIGEEAESFVINFEINRLNNAEKIPKQISTIDVAAGYDVLSYDTENSASFDRFIEVKAISESLDFHWSKNEIETAKLLGEEYYLYLVEVKKILQQDYKPLIIKNPYNMVFDSEDWILEPESFIVRKID